MLLEARNLTQLDFNKLMNVYAEGNRENGAELYPDSPAGVQVARAEENFREYLSQVFFRQSGAVYYIWEENGSYVSALRLEPYQDGMLLEALETRPESRRQGWSKRLIRSVQEKIPEGKLYSHVNRRNIPSQKVHESCGFRQVLDYAAYVDGSVNTYAVTLAWGK